MKYSCTCIKVRECDIYAGERLNHYKNNMARYDEDSITDEIIYRIQSNCSDSRVFHAHKEKVSGADIEWWVKIGDDFIGVRFQAKKLNREGLYSGIDHEIGGKGSGIFQIEELVNDSWKVGVVPLYCFYNYFEGTPLLSGWTYSFAHIIKNFRDKKTLGYNDPNFLFSNGVYFVHLQD